MSIILYLEKQLKTKTADRRIQEILLIQNFIQINLLVHKLHRMTKTNTKKYFFLHPYLNL